MPLPLLQLPSEHQTAIFRRTNYRSLCRLRRSSKRIDSFVEYYRGKISCRMSDNPWILIFTIKGKEERATERPSWVVFRFRQLRGLLTNKLGGPRLQRHVEISIIEATHSNIESAYDQMNKSHTKKPNCLPITDVYKQLSAMPIDIVYLDCGCPPLKFEDFVQQTRNHNEHILCVCREEVFPMLRVLKLHCERFWAFACPLLKELLPLVSFEKVAISQSKLTCQQWEELPIEHCSSIEIADIVEAPDSLAPFLSKAKSVKLRFKWIFYDVEELFVLFENFMNEICGDTGARGNLEYLEIVCSESNDDIDLEIPGPTQIWAGVPFDYKLPFHNKFFYKMQIAEGVAIIVRIGVIIHVYFFSYISRKELLLLLVPYLFERFPLDVSAIIDDFVNAATDEMAFDELYVKLWDSYEDWADEQELAPYQKGSDDDGGSNSSDEE